MHEIFPLKTDGMDKTFSVWICCCSLHSTFQSATTAVQKLHFHIPNAQIYPYLFGHIVDFVPRLTSDWIKVFRSCDSSRKMATAGMEKENSTFQGCFTRLAADNQKFIEYWKFQGFCLKRWQYSQKQNWKVKKGRFTYFYVFNIGN